MMISKMKATIKKPRAACISPIVICLLLCSYIIGFYLAKRFGNGSRFLQIFADTNHSISTHSEWIELFSSAFLSKSILLLFMVAAGLSAIGFAIIFLLFAVKGFGFGVVTLALWNASGNAGLAQIWAFQWIPEAIFLGMMLYLADAAWPLSRKLGRICFTAKGISMPLELRQRLVSRYLIVQICEIGICFLYAQLQMLLSGFL